MTRYHMLFQRPSSARRIAGSIARSIGLWGLVSTTLLTPGLANAKIYKLVDEDGNVSYTDVAPTDQEKRTNSALELNVNNSYQSKETLPAAASDSTDGESSTYDGDTGNPGDLIVTNESIDDTAPPPTAASAGYNSVTIVSPPINAALRSNNGDISLGVRLDPNLRPGDKVRFFLDGKPVGTVTGTSLALSNVDRGTHTVAAVVLDQAGKLRKSSSTQTFTLQRIAPLLKPKPPKAKS